MLIWIIQFKEVWDRWTCFEKTLGRENWKIPYLPHKKRSMETALWSRHGCVFLRPAEFHSWPWEVHTSKLSPDFCLASGPGQRRYKPEMKRQVRPWNSRNLTEHFKDICMTFWPSSWLTPLFPSMFYVCFKFSLDTFKCVFPYHQSCDLDGC